MKPRKEYIEADGSYPYCPRREIDEIEASVIVALYGESRLFELYEELREEKDAINHHE